MNDFFTYVRDTVLTHHKEWYDEVIYMMYRTIAWCVRDRVDTLTVTHTRVLYSRDGVEHEHFNLGKSDQEWESYRSSGRKEWTSFREAVSLILQNDECVRQHLQPIEETSEAVTYRIVPEDSTLG